ncbi:hypothetical protein [Hufsiella ginkgonis]|uniref:DUF308 domain-containing protein n=1 Tax=Hufsiella ginkgonis TaxID=2695274 RepID=A0A7K1Y235_9SPHI|nr:hypothetical protein [Hufsiella ginkgonis]MXV17138.1 hypothetical protein [Hufsiella ginkgonis]
MKENNLDKEITSIRQLMERSTKFISLSGLSGVMAGIYALIGAGISYQVVYAAFPGRYSYNPGDTESTEKVITRLLLVALGVVLFALVNGIWLTVRNAKKKGQRFWNPSSRSLMINMLIPLITGGLFILIMIFRSYFGLIAPACLIFYGLALINGSHFTVGDVKWLGICELVLGLFAALFPGYGLFFWAAGFGVLHIVYGIMMYYKYDR